MADAATATQIEISTPTRRVEKRRRSVVRKFRLLPEEDERLATLLAESGFPTLQALVLARFPEVRAS